LKLIFLMSLEWSQVFLFATFFQITKHSWNDWPHFWPKKCIKATETIIQVQLTMICSSDLFCHKIKNHLSFLCDSWYYVCLLYWYLSTYFVCLYLLILPFITRVFSFAICSVQLTSFSVSLTLSRRFILFVFWVKVKRSKFHFILSHSHIFLLSTVFSLSHALHHKV
jgi:hypothetical protein